MLQAKLLFDRPEPVNYITDGALVIFDGLLNRPYGHSRNTKSWRDLSGRGFHGTIRTLDQEHFWTSNGLRNSVGYIEGKGLCMTTSCETLAKTFEITLSDPVGLSGNANFNPMNFGNGGVLQTLDTAYMFGSGSHQVRWRYNNANQTAYFGWHDITPITWTSLAASVTVSENAVKLATYVNGVLSKQQDITLDGPEYAGFKLTTLLGYGYDAFTGTVHALRAYDRPLTAVEVWNNYFEDTLRFRGNLFLVSSPQIMNAYIKADGTVAAAATNRMVYINCKPSTTYTILRRISNGVSMHAGCCSEPPEYGTQTSGRQATEMENALRLTITSGPQDNYLMVRIWADVAALTLEQTFDTISIYEGE